MTPATKPSLRNRAAGEAGVTLIEMLVVCLTSIVVVLALFAIIDFTVRQTANATERVHANQRGRLAMEYLVNSLHSSCVAVAAVPVLEKSKGTELILLSESGTGAYFKTMTKHRIYLSGTTLYDAKYTSNGGIAPKWTFPASPTSTSTVLTGVSQSGATPLFRYYKYEGSTLPETELPTSGEGLSAENAKLTAAVKLAMTVAPETKENTFTTGKNIELADTVLLRFDPASTTSTNTPCT